MIGRHQADPSGQDPDPCLAGGGAMGALMRSTDWSRSPLGPVAEWPQSLKTAVSICLGSRFPISIWWGPESINLYNDACRPMLGDKHPRALGQKGQECWTEIWHIIGPMLEGVRALGEATSSDDQMLPLHRHGFTEECRFTFTYSPIRDESGDVGGVFCGVIETTERVLAARRQATLREPAAKAASARESIDACDAAGSWLDEDIGATQMLPAGPGEVDPKQLVAAVAQAVGNHARAPKRPRATAPSRSARRPRPKPVRSP